MTNFFHRKGILGSPLGLTCVSDGDKFSIVIYDQMGFIPTHDEIEEFIAQIRETYSVISEKDVETHNRSILDCLDGESAS